MGSCFSSDEPAPPLTVQSIENIYMNKIHEITTETEFNHIINDKQNVKVLIVCDFYAVWCQPCLKIAPILHKWALNDYKTSVIFLKIDVDQNSDLANQLSINVMPTFVLFKQGKEIYRLTGADSTNLQREIDKFK